MMVEQRHSSRHSWSGKQEAEGMLGTASAPSDTPPPTRPHLYTLPKQLHQQGTEYMTYEPMWLLSFRVPQAVRVEAGE